MLNNSDNIKPAEELLIKVVTAETTIWYYRYPSIQAIYELDDLIHENILYFYKYTKKGVQRLVDMLDKCTTQKHFINIIKATCRFQIPELRRLNYVKYFPLSLNRKMNSQDNDDGDEHIDFVKDSHEDLTNSVEMSDLYDAIIQCSDLYLKRGQDLSELISDHLSIIRDLEAGYKKIELQSKYKDFDTKLKNIKEIIKSFYESNQTSVSSVLGISNKR